MNHLNNHPLTPKTNNNDTNDVTENQLFLICILLLYTVWILIQVVLRRDDMLGFTRRLTSKIPTLLGGSNSCGESTENDNCKNLQRNSSSSTSLSQTSEKLEKSQNKSVVFSSSSAVSASTSSNVTAPQQSEKTSSISNSPTLPSTSRETLLTKCDSASPSLSIKSEKVKTDSTKPITPNVMGNNASMSINLKPTESSIATKNETVSKSDISTFVSKTPQVVSESLINDSTTLNGNVSHIESEIKSQSSIVEDFSVKDASTKLKEPTKVEPEVCPGEEPTPSVPTTVLEPGIQGAEKDEKIGVINSDSNVDQISTPTKSEPVIDIKDKKIGVIISDSKGDQINTPTKSEPVIDIIKDENINSCNNESEINQISPAVVSEPVIDVKEEKINSHNIEFEIDRISTAAVSEPVIDVKEENINVCKKSEIEQISTLSSTAVTEHKTEKIAESNNKIPEVIPSTSGNTVENLPEIIDEILEESENKVAPISPPKSASTVMEVGKQMIERIIENSNKNITKIPGKSSRKNSIEPEASTSRKNSIIAEDTCNGETDSSKTKSSASGAPPPKTVTLTPHAFIPKVSNDPVKIGFGILKSRPKSEIIPPRKRKSSRPKSTEIKNAVDLTDSGTASKPENGTVKTENGTTGKTKNKKNGIFVQSQFTAEVVSSGDEKSDTKPKSSATNGTSEGANKTENGVTSEGTNGTSQVKQKKSKVKSSEKSKESELTNGSDITSIANGSAVNGSGEAGKKITTEAPAKDDKNKSNETKSVEKSNGTPEGIKAEKPALNLATNENHETKSSTKILSELTKNASDTQSNTFTSDKTTNKLSIPINSSAVTSPSSKPATTISPPANNIETMTGTVTVTNLSSDLNIAQTTSKCTPSTSQNVQSEIKTIENSVKLENNLTSQSSTPKPSISNNESKVKTTTASTVDSKTKSTSNINGDLPAPKVTATDSAKGASVNKSLSTTSDIKPEGKISPVVTKKLETSTLSKPKEAVKGTSEILPVDTQKLVPPTPTKSAQAKPIEPIKQASPGEILRKIFPPLAAEVPKTTTKDPLIPTTIETVVSKDKEVEISSPPIKTTKENTKLTSNTTPVSDKLPVKPVTKTSPDSKPQYGIENELIFSPSKLAALKSEKTQESNAIFKKSLEQMKSLTSAVLQQSKTPTAAAKALSPTPEIPDKSPQENTNKDVSVTDSVTSKENTSKLEPEISRIKMLSDEKPSTIEKSTEISTKNMAVSKENTTKQEPEAKKSEPITKLKEKPKEEAQNVAKSEEITSKNMAVSKENTTKREPEAKKSEPLTKLKEKPKEEQNVTKSEEITSNHDPDDVTKVENISEEVEPRPTPSPSTFNPNVTFEGTLQSTLTPEHQPISNPGQGFGLVRASTGRKVSDSRYLTEMEVFFRSGALSQLEAQRDERLQDHVTRLQARCRGYLARRRFEKRKVQEVAVRCIQRNVRRFLQVRDWPWWRLLIRVAPLLNVHRAEEELKTKTEELETLRARLEKVETERTRLKQDSDRLEARLSELSVALSEEHSAATLASERLEAETAERMRLQLELDHVQTKHGELQQSSERLEMELLFCRAADMNGSHAGASSTTTEDEGDADPEGPVAMAVAHLRQRLERSNRELALTKRRLTQQHEDDLEQMMALKKMMEKKLADAYEEVEEQRQVGAQWKRKAQRMTSEGNDSRLLLEEQSARNNLLEKRHRKFDGELQQLQEALRQEKAQRERAHRERDVLAVEKGTLEQNLAACRLELEMREEKVSSLSRELEELSFSGAAEEEVAALRKSRHNLELKLKEQEEELDDLAGQVSMLEQAKLRLEMTLEQQRKEMRRELSQRDDELEEARCNAHKKVKALECQLESEHEERTRLLREKHDLERRLTEASEAARGRAPEDEQALARLRRDLRHTKALLRDAHTMLEKHKSEAPGKGQIRQLRHQLEDAEFARTTALKARQTAETELRETQAALEEAQRARADADDRAASAVRERTEARGQLEENEEEMAEVLKKYRAAVAQVSQEQIALQEAAGQVAALEAERNSLKEQLAEMSARVESAEGEQVSSLTQRRLEMKTRELESRLELELTTRARLETQISRLKDSVEKLQAEGDAMRAREAQTQDASRRLGRQLRESRESEATQAAREADWARKRKELELRTEAAEAEASTARTDLRLALQRVEDLQAAMAGELNSSATASEDSEGDSDSDESIESFLLQHKGSLSLRASSIADSVDYDISCRSPEGQSDPGDSACTLADESSTTANESHA